jgi:predicted nucleic acid-binding protein
VTVIVDSSVWIAHFKRRNEHLVELLEADKVYCHPYVIGELACGTPPNREFVLDTISELRRTPVATLEELREFIEAHNLSGRGCGFVDMNLLASARLKSGLTIWTLDKSLASAAADQGCLHSE